MIPRAKESLRINLRLQTIFVISLLIIMHRHHNNGQLLSKVNKQRCSCPVMQTLIYKFKLKHWKERQREKIEHNTLQERGGSEDNKEWARKIQNSILKP